MRKILDVTDLFNAELMNDAVYKFKRYEDSSLSYAGIESRHAHENVGLYDTVLTKEEYNKMYDNQQSTLT